ncbi:peroxisomal membrane anchor [Sporothrix schenckii 1099-18]|uniref:Peroxisomal membrane anchor n=1 Tax=Sporothrix schenckii 1099-18 TaxID=1397361 RepID=A0A0F2M2L4_SPOSC|nr:peroxisomal membrane anchor [Sporothrix schenckii 1099-18]KJR83933.1 peroxisomal membrane anchor [Sporothrix schenckii 1099-18]
MADSDPKDRPIPSAPQESIAESANDVSATHPETAPSQEESPSFDAASHVSADGESEANPASPLTEPSPPTLEQARIFLRDKTVQHESRPRKAAFLASKGLASKEIDQLLAEEDGPAATTEVAVTPQESRGPSAEQTPSRPPIVTYPEFMARPPQPPPLVTPKVFLGALYGSAAVSSLLYVTARLVLAPMVDTLTEARAELHDTAATNLTRLLGQLETVVSRVPEAAKASRDSGAPARSSLATASTLADDDGASTAETSGSYDDPTEVFHRDIGVQTSLPPSPNLAPKVTMDSTVPSTSTSLNAPAADSANEPSQSYYQAERLSNLVVSVRSLSQGWAGPSDVLSEIQTTVDVFREDVDKLSRPPAYAYGGGFGSSIYGYGSSISTIGSSSKYPGYVTTTRNEPDDEIRKAKENIRRVKGALLTTRTFPTAR